MTYLISAAAKDDILDRLSDLETKDGYITSVNKTSAFSITSADNRKIFSCSGTFTITLPALASLPDGINLMVKNNGTGTITIRTTSSQKIDTVTRKTVTPNECIHIISAADKYISSQTSSFIVP